MLNGTYVHRTQKYLLKAALHVCLRNDGGVQEAGKKYKLLPALVSSLEICVCCVVVAARSADESLLVVPPKLFVGDIEPRSQSGVGGLQLCDEVGNVVVPAFAWPALLAVCWALFCGVWRPTCNESAPTVVRQSCWSLCPFPFRVNVSDGP